jgi:hypothetical protein
MTNTPDSYEERMLLYKNACGHLWNDLLAELASDCSDFAYGADAIFSDFQELMSDYYGVKSSNSFLDSSVINHVKVTAFCRSGHQHQIKLHDIFANCTQGYPKLSFNSFWDYTNFGKRSFEFIELTSSQGGLGENPHSKWLEEIRLRVQKLLTTATVDSVVVLIPTCSARWRTVSDETKGED